MSAAPLQQPRNVATEYAALQFVFTTLLKRVQTAMPVKVMSVTNAGEVSAVGFVDVLPLVNQVTGEGESFPHATIYNVPYSRLQGGKNAVILDPQVGDIGVCVFASRDISAIKADPKAAVANDGANPGSGNTYDFTDAIYLGGILNDVPEQFVRFSAEGIELVSPTKVTVQAPTIELKGDVAHTEGDITSTGKYTGDGDVVGNDISLHDHHHGGIVRGGANTDPPS